MLVESSQNKDYGSYLVKLDIRWGDMDAFNHINNTLYFRYFEEARVRLFNELGMGLSDDNYQTVLAHTSCDFLKPLLYPADIVVGQRLVRVGRSSLDLECWVADANDPQMMYAQGRNVLVSTDSNTGKSKPWPDSFKQALTAFFDQ